MVWKIIHPLKQDVLIYCASCFVLKAAKHLQNYDERYIYCRVEPTYLAQYFLQRRSQSSILQSG